MQSGNHASRAKGKGVAFVLVVPLLLLIFSSQGADKSAPRSNLPANEEFAHWLNQLGSPAATTNADFLAAGLELAQKRESEMRLLLDRAPQEFARLALSATQRDSLPAAIQPHVEQHIRGRGSFSALCVFPPPDGQASKPGNARHAGYAFQAVVNGRNYRAFVYGPWKNQQTVTDAEIEGIALGDSLVLGDSPTPAQQTGGQLVTAYTPITTGPNTLLYMVARFSDQSSFPIDNATVFSQMAVVSNFWINGSGGRVYIKGLAYPTQVVDIVQVTLPQPSSYASTYNNNFAQLLSDARTAASAQGYNYANYNLDVVVTTGPGFSYAGLSYIGAQGSHWVTPYTSLRTAGHELGHNLGLYHANYWRTDSTQPFGEDSNPGGYVVDSVEGEWIEYGHYFSVMSAQYGAEWDDATKPIYNPAEKVQLGWLSGSQVQYVTTSGTYRLFRHDAESTVGTPRGIRIETPATDYTGYGHRYWLQYRYAPWTTAQNWYQNGVEVDVAETSYGTDGSIELDMTPYSNNQSSPFYDPSSPPGNWWTIDNSDKIDGALLLGRSYNDTAAGIHITPIAKGSNGTGEEYLDVVINLGGFSTDRPPVINSLTVSTNQTGVGKAVNLSVSASDPDGDTLAYSWSFDDAPTTFTTSGLNSATASKSWSTAGQYRVVATVSDMKGGVTTASTIITVAQPSNTGEAWGRVVWGGEGVYGAVVSTTVGSTVSQAWTESDGSYVLTDLPTNTSYTVNCAAAGLTFTPQFANPVSVASGAAYGIDFYANESLSTGGGSSFTISGQITDPINGASGVEVRSGGMVTTTDSSGNYQLTNFVNGTYTVVPTNAFWGFSPANRSVTISSANSTGNNFSRVGSSSISGSFSGVAAGNNSAAPTVYLSNGRSVLATKAGTGGNKYWTYTLNNVPAGQYSVTAEVSGYSISPSGFSNPLTISGNVSGVNFSGTAGSVAGAITGRITQYGLPLAGVSVSAIQGGSPIGSAVTDSDGFYRIDNLNGGAYSLTPSLSGFSFLPTSISVSGVPSSGNNFSAQGAKPPPTISSVTASPSTVPGVGATTTLSAAASGSGPLTYSWDALSAAGPVTYSVNDSSAAASTSVSFQVPGSYAFRARVADTNGFAATKSVNVTVSAGAGAMVVSPYEVQVSGGQTLAFHADAWDQLGNRITLSPTWSVSGGGIIDNTGRFTAQDAGGPFIVTATSGTLIATGSVWVISAASGIPPTVTTQPTNLTLLAGATATFVVAANGSTPLYYQWRLNGNLIGGATGSSFSKFNVQTNDAGTYSVLVTNSAGQAVSAGATLKVQMVPSVTWLTPANISYGTPLGPTQLNASSPVAGVFAYSPPAGTLLNAANSQTLSATFTPTDTNAYVPVLTNVLINIQKALLSVTALTTNKVYNAPLPALTSVYSGFVNSDTTAKLSSLPTLSCSATPTSPVGSYPIQLSGGVSSNYAFQLLNGTLTVTPATPLLTWTNPAPLNYGTPLGASQLNASASVPGNFAYTPISGTVLNCGTNLLSVLFTPTDSSDYFSTTSSVAVAVFMVYDGINISDPVQALADKDGDRLPNLVEYALGTNPNDPSDAQRGISISITNNAGSPFLLLGFKRRHDTTAFPLLYVPEVSGDGVSWFSDATHVLQLNVVTSDAQFDWVTVQDSTPQTSVAPRFIRLRVQN